MRAEAKENSKHNAITQVNQKTSAMTIGEVVSFSGKTGAETSTAQKIPMGRKEHPLL